MKRNPDMRFFPALLLFLCAVNSWAQLVQVPIVHKAETQKQNKAARVQQLSSMLLPFWDDFSFSNSENFPHDSLWQYGRSVWVNTGMGINAPTLKVATFDGIDSLGKPYSISLPYAKGIADKLISRPLRMDLVNPADSIFIFFYYQYEGNGEMPDPGDELSLWLKNDSSEWNKVWPLPSDSIVKGNTKFTPVKIKIKDSHYFHNNFQFRFQNYARLSGPFDTWNLDYVYINNGKAQYAPIYADFPDRAIASPISSAFLQYQSIPIKHFLTNPDSILTFPSIAVTNQRKDQTRAASYPQPVNMVTRLTTTTRLNKTVTQNTIQLDSLNAQPVYYDQPTIFTLNAKPSFTGLDPKTDSIALKFQIKLNTADRVDKISVNVGDYDTLVYKGIDFRFNDTTSTNFILRDYYAYDDGIAEYAVTLTQPGANLAYQFDMAHTRTDTLVALDVYFPHVGDESNQVLLIKVWNNLASHQVDSLQWTVQRTENNKFVRIPLDHGVLVKKKFFVGWKQSSAATIGVGFDKDSDSGSKIFYLTADTLIQVKDLHGNLMIRPVFGNTPLEVIAGVEEKTITVYPNPCNGVFYLPSIAQNLQVMDVAGRSVSFVEEVSFDQKQITLSNPYAGLYLIRFYNGSQWHTEKIMVLR
jgi:hypothetical protein